MKGGLYIAILLGALLCKVSGDEIKPSENEPGFHYSTGGEVKSEVYDADEREWVDSPKYDVEELDDDKTSTTEITKAINDKKSSSEEVSIGIDINSASENNADDLYKSINSDVNSENISAEDLTEFNESKTNKSEQLPVKEKASGKIDKFSRDDEPHEIFSSGEERSGIHNEIHASPHEATSPMDSLNSTMFSTVNHYFCKTDKIAETQLILYGTKAWTFPLQNVNLTLSYPTAKSASTLDSAEEVDFIITGFKVILYIDGVQTRGYITNGGVLQDKISMTFINSNITSLLYKFWLYGTPKQATNVTELHMTYYLCS